VYGTSKVLRFADIVDAERVVFASSSAVYGEDGKPENPYGLQKLMSEMECDLYSRLYGVDTVSLRYFNVYSEDQPYDGPYSTVIANWMHLLEEGEPLRIDGDGKQRRDFIHVEDVVDATIACGFYEGELEGKSFDVGTGKNHSINEIKKYVELLQNDVEFRYSEHREGDVESTLADISQITETVDWEPEISFDEGMKRCFKQGE
jgi:UDP-glucose 4-epimerase